MNVWCVKVDFFSYTPLTKLLAQQARPGTTHDGSGTKAETYSSILATKQHQSRQKIYQKNCHSFFVSVLFCFVQNYAN